MPKTLSDIIPPSKRRAMREDMGVPQEDKDFAPERPRKGRRKFPYGFVIGALVVVVACLALLIVFSGATIKIVPTVNETTVSGEWSATPSVGDLPFEVITIDQVASDEVPAEGTETAEVAAQGSITIYNAQEKPQELIKNTRFETADGKIFRIQESVTVPAGSASSPGTLTTTVYADAAGDSYNVGPSTFTLPGLKGGALYDLVYAKSDSAMVGGFSGTRPSVGQGVREKTYEELRPELEKKLHDAIVERIPEGYVLLNGAVFTSYAPLPDAPKTSSSVSIEYKGTATAFVFPNNALGKALAYRLVANYNGEEVSLLKTDALTFSYLGEGTPSAGVQSLPFSLSGQATIVWNIDETEVIEAVAGKTRDAARTILKSFPEVSEGSIVLRPFWYGTLPTDLEKIEVKVEEVKSKN